MRDTILHHGVVKIAQVGYVALNEVDLIHLVFGLEGPKTV
jgi:hypothetical protein